MEGPIATRGERNNFDAFKPDFHQGIIQLRQFKTSCVHRGNATAFHTKALNTRLHGQYGLKEAPVHEVTQCGELAADPRWVNVHRQVNHERSAGFQSTQDFSEIPITDHGRRQMLEHMAGKSGVDCVVTKGNRQAFGKVPLDIAPRHVRSRISDHVFRYIEGVSVLEGL
jgi:hypothetical protein